MYNIEERINNWYNTKAKTPVVSNDDALSYSQDKNSKSKTTTKGIVSKPSTRNELLHNLQLYAEKLGNINEDMKENFEEYEIKSDEEINKIAENESSKKFENKYLKENLKNEIELKELNDKKQQAVNDSKIDVEKIEKFYDDEAKDSKNSAIKNGISRSTILDGQVESIKNFKKADVEKVNKDLEETLKSTDDKIKNEETRHDVAINEIDASKEEKKQAIIDDLKAKREKIKELGGYVYVDFDGKIKKTSGASKEMLDIYRSVIDDCLTYYQSLDKDMAIKEYLEDTEIQEVLGDYEDMIRTYVTGKGQSK